MDYTFVPQYNGEVPKKRRLAKACETCRARKKRCHHHPLDEEDGEQAGPVEDSGHDHAQAPPSADYRGISVRKGNSNRFLSDLSPETRLLERTSVGGENGLAKSMDSVGIWVNRSDYETLVRECNAARGVGFRSDEAQSIKPTATQIQGLIDVYFKKIHPFLPLLEEHDFRRAYAEGSIPEALTCALCLVSAKDSDAQQYFTTPESNPWSPRKLCKNLHAKVKAAVAAPGRQDKITQICMLAVLSMHSEGSDGAEEASLYLIQAIHQCQTLGLHLSASFPARDGKHTKRLFWCLWILDRFSAAMNGRPIMMADNDVAIEQFQPGESGFPAFEVLLKITAILNQVIGYYRPGNPATTTGWEQSYPGYEEIVDSIVGWNLPPSLLSTLHIAYLTVTILSHRSKGAADFASTTPSYLRQSLAAIQIIRLMSPARLPTLHALPILPYAISLALSVSYQHLRQDQLVHQQEDARADFEACYAILRELKHTWPSADPMSTLSEKVVEELTRIPSIVSFRIRRQAQDKELQGFTSACKHDGDAVGFSHTADAARPLPTTDRNMLVEDMQQLYTPAGTDKELMPSSNDLFEGIDDIFGTYLDPNYPVNLDFLDDHGNIDPGEWPLPSG
ncbi:hypothetical protein AMS68_007005 [Peltaster fructicola]|uniref:Xylanolytic transcriptional activator regulatory domain-containing protein n=1 Tax=Peltaster fructicola TaxID=286661 RepID=A0A6H0Y3R9_9PEZI|nr:hypothetical protein AMS68_007005 [Peltaster fructicola]